MIPEVEDVEPAAASWGLTRVGTSSRGRTGSGVNIYVQDTGIRYSHQDFGGRAVPAIDLTTGGLKECGSDTSCALDRQGHGTHCAGTAGGTTFGVASTASLHAVKTLSDRGSGARSWQMAAIDWVTANGARPAVISMSLGGRGADPAYTASIGAATNAGVVVVVAAGNSNSDSCNFSPAFAASAITVGSSTSLDARSSFSNFGACTNIWAPGSDILSAGVGCDTCTAKLSGTSMACPHVSGGAALILSADPTKTAPAVLQQLLDDAYWFALDDLKFRDTNALLCVAEGGAPDVPTPQPTPVPPPGSWVIMGSGCEEDGACVQSLNHPENYGNRESCQVGLYGNVSIEVEAFLTESNFDELTIGGNRYSGLFGPRSGVYSGVITWTSDFADTRSGWRFCKN